MSSERVSLNNSKNSSDELTGAANVLESTTQRRIEKKSECQVGIITIIKVPAVNNFNAAK